MTDADPIRLYWWGKKTNFGDLIGPWLVREMSGRPVRNIKGRSRADGVTGLATVGSLIQNFDRPGLEVWGTGTMKPISRRRAAWLAARRPSRIHAVRGPKTHWHITRRLGWEAPKIYGDPAVLLPRLYTPGPRPDVAGKTAIVAHHTHAETLKRLDPDRFHWVEVIDDPDTVVDQIAAAGRVISSSLHGLIVAQAYGVPWTWLQLGDELLAGSGFKYEDFFASLDREQVSEAVVPDAEVSDVTFTRLGEQATAPRWTMSFDPLWDAFPYHR